MADWTWIPPAVSGRQVEGTGLLPFGRYRMPDGSEQVSFGLPQGGLDLWRGMRQGLGFEQDPSAPQGYVSQNAMIRAAVGGAGGAITGALGLNAARAAGQNAMLRRATVSSGGTQPDVPKPITAYHGSPHDFDRFDLAKINTGEGNQAYGHGLYFAEHPAVAEGYKTRLSSQGVTGELTFGGRTFGKTADPDELKRFVSTNAMKQGATERQATAAGKIADNMLYWASSIDEEIPSAIKKGWIDQADEPAVRAVLDQASSRKNEGRLYKVEINARPEQFLDWDKPLSQQPENIQKIFSQEAERLRSGGQVLLPQYMKALDDGSLSGHQLFGLMGSGEQAAKRFSEAGIPGIRYLDQGSRTDGKGTYNYVIFDDSLVKIAEKYGLTIPGPGIANGEDQEQPLTAVRGKDMRKLIELAKRDG